MFSQPDDIGQLVDLLVAREVGLWHACQLRDLQSYLALGGIPSHLALERAQQPFTSLVSDLNDRRHGVWDKVFLNLSDSGEAFARGACAVPNPYGPIAMLLAPRVLEGAVDVAISLRSAGARDFDRARESLGTVDAVDRLFRHPATNGPLASHIVRTGPELVEAFPDRPEAMTPELSCTYADGIAPLAHATVILVDPITIRGVALRQYVEDACLSAGVATRVRERQLSDLRLRVMTELVRVLSGGQLPLQLLARRDDVSAETREWARSLLERDLWWQFDRYARYLIDGTLSVFGLGEYDDSDADEIDEAGWRPPLRLRAVGP